MAKNKIYKNLCVSRESYFVDLNKTKRRKNEFPSTKGYQIDFIDEYWHISEAEYYKNDLKNAVLFIKIAEIDLENVILYALLDELKCFPCSKEE